MRHIDLRASAAYESAEAHKTQRIIGRVVLYEHGRKAQNKSINKNNTNTNTNNMNIHITNTNKKTPTSVNEEVY